MQDVVEIRWAILLDFIPAPAIIDMRPLAAVFRDPISSAPRAAVALPPLQT